MGRSTQYFVALAQYLFVVSAYGLCVGIAAGVVPGILAGIALLGLMLLSERTVVEMQSRERPLRVGR